MDHHLSCWCWTVCIPHVERYWDLLQVKNELVAVKHEFKDFESGLTKAYAATDKLRENCDRQVSSITAKYRAEVRICACVHVCACV